MMTAIAMLAAQDAGVDFFSGRQQQMKVAKIDPNDPCFIKKPTKRQKKRDRRSK